MAVNDRWSGTASAPEALVDRSKWPGTASASTDFGSAAPIVPVPVDRFMSAGAAVPTGLQTLDSTNQLARCRTKHVIFATGPTVRVELPLFYVADGAAGETQIPMPAGTVLKVSFELVPISGSASGLVRAKFSGASELVSPTGSVVSTDAMSVTSFNPLFVNYVPSDIIWVKQEWAFPSTGGMLSINDSSGNTNASGGENMYYGGTTSVDVPGNLAANGGTLKANRLSRPLCLVGPHNGEAVLGIGDSITFGKDITVAGGDGSGTTGGWFAMAAYQAAMPHVKAGKSGDEAKFWASGVRGITIALARYATCVMDQLGTNDTGVAGVSSTTVMGYFNSLYDKLRAANPDVRIYGGKVVLRVSSSTDGYTTLAGQTVRTGYAQSGGVRMDVGAAKAALVGTKLFAVYDLNPALCDSIEQDKWDVASGALTGDGTHPYNAGAIRMAAIAKPLIEGMRR